MGTEITQQLAVIPFLQYILQKAAKWIYSHTFFDDLEKASRHHAALVNYTSQESVQLVDSIVILN